MAELITAATIPVVREIAIFSGSAHRELAAEICAQLNVELHPARTTRFANDCLEVPRTSADTT